MSYLSLPSGAVARPLISGVTNAAGLRAVAPSASFGQGITAVVAGLGSFAFDTASLAVDNGTTVIKPDDILVGNPGRWLATGGGGGGVGGGGTATRIPVFTAATTVADSDIAQLPGAIATATKTANGAGYPNGIYPNQPLINGTGTGATVDIGVGGGGGVVIASLRSPGSGYTVGDVLTVALAPGVGFQFTVNAVVNTENASTANARFQRLGVNASPRSTLHSQGLGLFDASDFVMLRSPMGGAPFNTIYFRTNLAIDSSGEAGAKMPLSGYDGYGAGIVSAPNFDTTGSLGSTQLFGIASYATATTLGSNASLYGLSTWTYMQDASIVGRTLTLYGVHARVRAFGALGSNSFSAMTGIDVDWQIRASNAQTVNNAYGFRFLGFLDNAAHSINQFYTLYLGAVNIGGGATIGTYYGIYQDDAAAINVLNAPTGIGFTAVPNNAWLQLAGASTARASLHFDDGVVTPTVPAIGDVWRFGSDLKFYDVNIVATNGDFVVGTSGRGVDFSATPNTGSSELFDDYEEGTWTPSFTATGGGTVAIVAGDTEAVYTKKGQEVTVSFSIAIGNITGTPAGVQMNGLPYKMSAGGGTYGMTIPIDIYSGAGFANKFAGFGGTIYNGTADVELLWYDHDGVIDLTPGPNLVANNTVLSGSFSYVATI